MPMYVYKHAHDHLMECLCLTLKGFLLCFRPYAFHQNLNYYAPGFEGTCQLYVSSYDFFDCEVCIIPVGALYLMPFIVYYVSIIGYIQTSSNGEKEPFTIVMNTQ